MFNKILKWKKKAGDLERQERMVAYKLRDPGNEPVDMHNVQTIKRKLALFSREIGLTNDEVTILVFTSLDHGWLNNLLVLAGEFTTWFSINFEGEGREEKDFLLAKLELWKAATTYAQCIIDEAAKLKGRQEIICEHGWWEKLRFQKIGSQLAAKLKQAPKLK
jgi:hypothetical protein